MRPSRRKGFLWQNGVDPAAWREVRVPVDGQEATHRSADQIPPEELANAAEWVVQQAISISRDELVRETAFVFGITRRGRRVREAVEGAIGLLVDSGRCVEDGDDIRVRAGG